LPERLTRISTRTLPALDSVASGDMDVLSSSTNARGRSATCIFRMATGMRDPSMGRARMKTVSFGATWPRSVSAMRA